MHHRKSTVSIYTAQKSTVSQDHARHTLHEVVRSGKSRRHYRLLNGPSEVTNSPWIIWCTPVPWAACHEVKLSRTDDPPRHHEVSIGSYGGTKWNGHFAEVKARPHWMIHRPSRRGGDTRHRGKVKSTNVHNATGWPVWLVPIIWCTLLCIFWAHSKSISSNSTSLRFVP